MHGGHVGRIFKSNYLFYSWNVFSSIQRGLHDTTGYLPWDRVPRKKGRVAGRKMRSLAFLVNIFPCKHFGWETRQLAFEIITQKYIQIIRYTSFPEFLGAYSCIFTIFCNDS